MYGRIILHKLVSAGRKILVLAKKERKKEKMQLQATTCVYVTLDLLSKWDRAAFLGRVNLLSMNLKGESVVVGILPSHYGGEFSTIPLDFSRS